MSGYDATAMVKLRQRQAMIINDNHASTWFCSGSLVANSYMVVVSF